MNTYSVKHNLQKLTFVSENTFATTFHETMGDVIAILTLSIFLAEVINISHRI